MSFTNDFASLLVNKATISSFIDVTGSIGGTQKTYSPVGSYIDLPCSRQGISGAQKLFANQLQITVTHGFYFNQILNLQNGYILTDENGFNYIIEYWDDQSGSGEVFFILANKIETQGND